MTTRSRYDSRKVWAGWASIAVALAFLVTPSAARAQGEARFIDFNGVRGAVVDQVTPTQRTALLDVVDRAERVGLSAHDMIVIVRRGLDRGGLDHGVLTALLRGVVTDAEAGVPVGKVISKLQEGLSKPSVLAPREQIVRVVDDVRLSMRRGMEYAQPYVDPARSIRDRARLYESIGETLWRVKHNAKRSDADAKLAMSLPLLLPKMFKAADELGIWDRDDGLETMSVATIALLDLQDYGLRSKAATDLILARLEQGYRDLEAVRASFLRVRGDGKRERDVRDQMFAILLDPKSIGGEEFERGLQDGYKTIQTAPQGSRVFLTIDGNNQLVIGVGDAGAPRPEDIPEAPPSTDVVTPDLGTDVTPPGPEGAPDLAPGPDAPPGDDAPPPSQPGG